MVKYLDNNSGFRQWNANRNVASDVAKKPRIVSFLWWVAIIMAAWWMLSLWMSPHPENTEPVSATVQIDLSAVPVSNVSSDKISAQVQGLRISNIELSEFDADTSDTETARMTLLDGDNNFIEAGYVATGATAPTATSVWANVDGAYMWRSVDGLDFTRTINADGYVITITDTVQNNSANAVSLAPYARILRDAPASTGAGVDTGLIAYVNSDVENKNWRSLDKKSYAYSTVNGFVGFAEQYWETVVCIDRPDQTIRAKKSGDKYESDVAAGAVSIAPGASEVITTRIFAGPRDQSVLSSVGGIIAGIDETVDYGWFWFLARPMLWILNGLNSIVMNYGIAIILMTILLRLLMWPLTRKSYTSMIAMQKMQPEIARIQKLYANDKPRMQMEMMRLYQTHKTSPMSGCLPMLIQIPIFFALYKALLVSVPMRGAHFLWIHDLAAMDPYFILPILMGATMWLQQYLQSAATKKADLSGNDVAAQTQRVMKWMPVIFTIMFAWMPAGLVLYWTVSNLFGILQMYIIKYRSNK